MGILGRHFGEPRELMHQHDEPFDRHLSFRGSRSKVFAGKSLGLLELFGEGTFPICGGKVPCRPNAYRLKQLL
jgi:hypothetical protein